MIAGSSRYARSLGFVAGLGEETPAESARTPAERILGFDFTGKLKTSGGSGITVGMSPSTFVGALLGTMIGVALAKNKVGGALGGGIAGAIAATTLRAASHYGV